MNTPSRDPRQISFEENEIAYVTRHDPRDAITFYRVLKECMIVREDFDAAAHLREIEKRFKFAVETQPLICQTRAPDDEPRASLYRPSHGGRCLATA